MSTETAEDLPQEAGFPELSSLGKRIELLRIERGMSKQRLAREADTSRQQLWRVMTGKSELTASLCHRLAEALQVDARILREGGVLARPAEGTREGGEERPADFGIYAAAV